MQTLYICARIDEMEGKVTIKDIAKELNISYSTVSRALNGISKDTARKKQIEKKAKEMGYRPNMAAQQLRQGHSNTIGLIVPRINRVFFSNVIHGVETIAKQLGYNVLICQTNEHSSEEIAGLETFLKNNVAGIIMSITTETEDITLHKNIIDSKVPLVMFDRIIDGLPGNMVINDNFMGAYKSVVHLIEQGYTKIAHFAGPVRLNVYNDRLRGYKSALTDHNISIDDKLIFQDSLTKEKGEQAIQCLIAEDTDFDAVFSASDYSALGAYDYLKSVGRRIPEEIGIVGFSNEPFTELLGLTTVEQYSIEIGKSAARLLFEEIEQDEVLLSTKEICIKTELLIRKSTIKQTKDD